MDRVKPSGGARGRMSPWHVFLFASPFLFGLFYEFAACLAGVLLCLFLVLRVRQSGRLLVGWNWVSAGVWWVVVWYGLAVFWAADRGMAFLGFCRFLPAGLFLLAFAQLDARERARSFLTVPYAGAAMTLLSALCWLIPAARASFFQADRLGGFFQYANSFALFLLLGIIVLAFQERPRWYEWIAMAVLTAGILLTGSRTTFVLLLLNAGYLAWRRKPVRRFFLFAVPAALLLGVIVVAATGSYQNFGRFLTISLRSSTFLGRLLYDYDGLRMLAHHPFGLGYLGYYYCQPAFQSGVYSVRLIHNDFLQLALDAGLPALAGWLTAVGCALFGRRTGPMRRMLLLTICIHGLFDFDLNFLSIVFVALMAMAPEPEPEQSRELDTSTLRRAGTAVLGCVAAVLLWAGTACFANYCGADAAALRLYPWHTEARLAILPQAESPEQMERMADKILVQNPHVALAYEARASAAASAGEYDRAIRAMERAVDRAPYHVPGYERLLSLLLDAAIWEDSRGNREKALDYLTCAQEIPQQLAAMEARTSPLAFQIRDQPVFTLSEQALTRLDQTAQQLSHTPGIRVNLSNTYASRGKACRAQSMRG